MPRPPAPPPGPLLAFGLCAALGGGCGSEGPLPAVPAPPGVSPSAAAPPTASPPMTVVTLKELDPDLRWRLEKDAVHHCCVAKKTLYTWTTRAQIDELRTAKVLLTRGESATRGLSRFDRQLEARTDPASRMLRQPGLSRRRFAWSNPWATLLGWGEAERYGEELLRVTIRDNARIGIFDASANPPWRFVETDNTPVSIDDALAAPERIAVVYHVYRPAPGEPEALAYREYVLVNETMVQQWAFSTPDITQRLTEDIATFGKLKSALRDGLVAPDASTEAEFAAKVSGSIWPQAMDRPTVPFVFGAALALPNKAYLLNAASIDSLLAALQRALPRDPSMAHYPNGVFDLRSGAPPKPPPPQKYNRRLGTF